MNTLAGRPPRQRRLPAPAGPIVVLAPHPDDESLGCGGLLANAFAGKGATVVCLTDGSGSHPRSRRYPAPRLAERRARELREAVTRLGGTHADIVELGHRDGACPTRGSAFDASVARVSALCVARRATMLFATSGADQHTDHQACEVLARAVQATLPALGLYAYPVWSRRDRFAPDAGVERRLRWLDTSGVRDAKARAIAAHRTQLGLVVDDDSDGFVLEPTFVARFVEEDECFIEIAPARASLPEAREQTSTLPADAGAR
ncbi:MAG: PIG-L deacetylase family protein [Lautropia sp.]